MLKPSVLKLWITSRARSALVNETCAIAAVSMPCADSTPGDNRPGAGHLSTKKDTRVGDWAAANKVELGLRTVLRVLAEPDRVPIHRTARYFALDGTDHNSHAEQASMIRRYLIWRNTHTTDPRLRKVVTCAAIIKRAKVA